MKRLRFLAIAVAASVLAVVGCASGGPRPSPEVLQRIETAQSRADHQWLADYFSQEAGKARGTAAEHREMARAYRIRPGMERGAASMVAHCNAIVNSFEAVAGDYDRMAAAHRQMAAEAKP